MSVLNFTIITQKVTWILDSKQWRHSALLVTSDGKVQICWRFLDQMAHNEWNYNLLRFYLIWKRKINSQSLCYICIFFQSSLIQIAAYASCDFFFFWWTLILSLLFHMSVIKRKKVINLEPWFRHSKEYMGNADTLRSYKNIGPIPVSAYKWSVFKGHVLNMLLI